MTFAIVFFLNALANFALGILLSAILGPEEFGLYATTVLAATTAGLALFDWLRLSAIRFSRDPARAVEISSSLDVAYLVMMGLTAAAAVVCGVTGFDFGLRAGLLGLLAPLTIGIARYDYSAAFLRGRNDGRAFAWFCLFRHGFTFATVLALSRFTHDARAFLLALAVSCFIPMTAQRRSLRGVGEGVSAATWEVTRRFAGYAAPIVISTVLYQSIALINRRYAITHFGLADAGRLSLATDVGFRLFLALNVLPETLLFDWALRRERNEGRAAAEAQLSINGGFVLALLVPLATAYCVLAPTIGALIVPSAYRESFFVLAPRLAPGLLAYCLMLSVFYPIFQLAQRTLPLTVTATAAVVTDLALLYTQPFSDDVAGLAACHSAALGVACLVAAIFGFRARAVRPRLRDAAGAFIAAAALALVVRPFNGFSSPLASAGLAAIVGGGAAFGILLAADAAGLRGFALSMHGRLRSPGRPILRKS